jgi:hypothetical protein
MITLYAAAGRMRELQHARPQSLVVAENTRYLQAAREKLGERCYDAAWKRGRAMTGEQACDFALGSLTQSTRGLAST